MTPARFAACPPSGAGVGPIRTELSDLQDLDCLSLGGRVTSRTGVESARNKQSRRCKKAEGHRCGSGTLRPRCGTRPPAVAVRELHATAFAACGRPAAADGAAATVGRRAAKRPGAQNLPVATTPVPPSTEWSGPGDALGPNSTDRRPAAAGGGASLRPADGSPPRLAGRKKKDGGGASGRTRIVEVAAVPSLRFGLRTVKAVRTPNSRGSTVAAVRNRNPRAAATQLLIYGPKKL